MEDFFDYELTEDDLIFEGGITQIQVNWLISMGLIDTQRIKVPLITVNIQMG